MGVKGYQEFKMKLSLSVTPEDEIAQEKDVQNWNDDSLEFMLDKILSGHMNALKETRMLLRMEDVVKTVELMEKATNIYFFGIGDMLCPIVIAT